MGADEGEEAKEKARIELGRKPGQEVRPRGDTRRDRAVRGCGNSAWAPMKCKKGRDPERSGVATMRLYPRQECRENPVNGFDTKVQKDPPVREVLKRSP